MRSPHAPRLTIPASQRFWHHVTYEPNTGCWLWSAALDSSGYAQLRGDLQADGTVKYVRVHRMSYEMVNGQIPEGLVLDHLCRNKWCVNPAHLEPVTNRENLMRGHEARRAQARTHCPQGHAFTDETTYRSDNGKRQCKECRRANVRRWRERNKGVH